MTTSLPEHAQPMEVMNSVNAAIARTRRMLFQPFNLSKWVVLGVIIFLDVWFGGGRNFGGGGNFNPGGGQWQSMRDIGDRCSPRRSGC